MVEIKNFMFYGTPIEIRTEKWSMKFSSIDECTSTVKISKRYNWGEMSWIFQIIEEEYGLQSYPIASSSDDPIGKCVWHLKECSDKHKLNWSAVDATFLSMIPYLNE